MRDRNQFVIQILKKLAIPWHRRGLGRGKDNGGAFKDDARDHGVSALSPT
jgi:hypothetical protein